MSCITTLCQLFKAVALLIPIDNLPVKIYYIFFYGGHFENKNGRHKKIIIEKCSLVQYTFFNITVIIIKSFFSLSHF